MKSKTLGAAAIIAATFLINCLPPLSFAADAPASQPTGTLAVDGEVAKPLTLSVADLAKYPHETVTATEHDGSKATYTGVAVRELLKAAGVPIDNDKLRGKALALYLVAEGADHYKAVFALAEMDAEFGDRHILVADARNGQPLDAKSAPLKIVAPDDKKLARSVRMLMAIHVRRAD